MHDLADADILDYLRESWYPSRKKAPCMFAVGAHKVMCLLRASVWRDGIALFMGAGQIRCS